MNKYLVDLDLDGVARVKNALDPVDLQDYVTKSFGDANYLGGGGFQKYFIAPLEAYTIPQYVSSVITGPMDIEGIVVVDGRLEVL